MTRSQLIIATAFLGIFGAGVISALVAGKFLAPKPAEQTDRRGPRSMISERLQLTPDQHEKMREIWSAFREQQSAQSSDARRALQQQRDEQLRSLLSDEQKSKHEVILAKYESQMLELKEKGDAAFQLTVQKTREILTPDQRTKYDEMLKERTTGDRRDDRRDDRRGPPGPPGGGFLFSDEGRGPGGKPPTTQPAPSKR